jgi:hypothetical protein
MIKKAKKNIAIVTNKFLVVSIFLIEYMANGLEDACLYRH